MRTRSSAPPQPNETDSWWGKRQSRMQVLPRVQGHPFDPYTQAREDLYIFKYDIGGPRLFFDQGRSDGARVGQLEQSAVGGPRASIMQLNWHKHSGGVYEVEFIGDRGMAIAEGYCKLTDVGGPAPDALGSLKWVVVVTRLWGRDLPATQTDALFSPPLYEALATGVAFGLYPDDTKIQLSYPRLGAGRASIGAPVGGISLEARAPPVPTPAAEGQSASKWSVTNAVDDNVLTKFDSTFERFTPTGAKIEGCGMAVRNARGDSLGSLFPLRKPEVDVVSDASEVYRIEVVETPVKFHQDESLIGVSRYEVVAYSASRKKLAEFDVAPVALPMVGSSNKLAFKHHITKPKIGTTWMAGPETIIISRLDQAAALKTAPMYDPRLHAAIEAGMYQLRAQHNAALATVQ